LVEKAVPSLKKLRAFVIAFPAGPLLKVLAMIQFEGLKVWGDAVTLTHPDRLRAPLPIFMAVSPASDFAWPAGMPTETRIACFIRLVALFADHIRQTSGPES